jgi:uncharacterized protein
MNERQGIEIDYCPQCRGVLLDRGELDKVIARSEAVQAPPATQPAPGSPAGGWTQPATPPPPRQQPWGVGQHGYRYGDGDDDEDRGYGYGGRRRKSWLKEIVD